MEKGHAVSEPPDKTQHRLSGEGNFRYQHNRLTAFPQCIRHEFNVYHRFPAARHAIEKNRPSSAGRRPFLPDPRQHAALFFREYIRFADLRLFRHAAVQFRRGDLQDPFPLKPFDHLVRHAGFFLQFAEIRPAVHERPYHSFLCDVVFICILFRERFSVKPFPQGYGALRQSPVFFPHRKHRL